MPKMAEGKPPVLSLGDDKALSVRIWRKKFNSWCILQADWRDTSKAPNDNEHWKAGKYNAEIAAFYLALPDEVLTIFEISILPKMSEDEKKRPWSYQEKLAEHYQGRDNVMPERLNFFNCTQKASETIYDYETRIRSIASKTKFELMTNPLQELMRDRLCTGVHNHDLRQILLQHYKEDGKTVLTFEDQLNKAKAWEAAHRTNALIEQTTHITELVNFSKQVRPSEPSTQPSHSSSSSSRLPCGWCGGPRHSRSNCPANQPRTVCQNYGMKGNHYTSVCRQRKATSNHSTVPKQARKPYVKQAANAVEEVQSSGDETDYVVNAFSMSSINGANNQLDDKFFTWLRIAVSPNRTVKVLMQVDSAATCNTLPSHVYEQLLCKEPMKHTRSHIAPYNAGSTIKPIGQQSFACEGTSSFQTLNFQVIDSNDIPGKPALLSGKDALQLGLVSFHDKVFASQTSNITLPVRNAYAMGNTAPLRVNEQLQLEDVLSSFKDSFVGLGLIGTPAHIQVNPSVTPIHAGYHRIPVAKLERVKTKLDEMVQAGKLEKVEHSTAWCSNMLVRETVKADGSTKMRLCLDPSQTVNKAIIIPKYQIPTIQELLPRLSHKKHKLFTIIDALDGFTQVELDEASKDLTTMHTPWSRFRWCRLPYGISCAPDEFQRRIHEALEGLDGVFSIADDVLVMGQGNTPDEAEREHDRHLLALMNRSVACNLKWNPKKIQFKLSKVTFMGNVFTEEGVSPDPNKIKAITDMPTPKDKAAVQRFCGMINYLSSFCPNLAYITKPLYDLMKQDSVFLWSATHDTAFNHSKALIATAPCLAYFDSLRKVILQVDASQEGLGGALLQPNDDDKLQPVAFTSCKLRPNEEKWAQIEKECLAIVSACDKWDQWLYGLDVTVHTDHQPLGTIFKKPLHAAPRRLQRMMLRLQRYKLHVVYKKGSSLKLADTLSRAHLNTTNDSRQTNFEVFRISLGNSFTPTDISTRTLSVTKSATAQDTSLQSLIELITSGWPPLKSQIPTSLWPYWTYRDELSVNDGVVYKGSQMLIPKEMRNNILQKVHVAHFGAESNIRMCKDFLFWPGMANDIRAMCQSCGKCAQFGPQNPKEPMRSQPIPHRPWQYVSQDIASFDHGNYLITVDHYSDFIEVDELPNTLASTVVAKTEAHIARYGVFDTLLTDNGPQFIATEFEGMCQRYGIQHVTSSPYWPQGNGKAEASVKVIKSIMKKSGIPNLYEALLNHRNTSPTGHDLSPSQRCMGRRTNLPLPLADFHLAANVSPACLDAVPDAILAKRESAKTQYDKRNNHMLPVIGPGAYVYAKPSPHRKSGPWDYGVVSQQPQPNSFVIDTPNGVIRRNRVHLRLAAPPPPGQVLRRDRGKPALPPVTEEDDHIEHVEPPPCDPLVIPCDPAQIHTPARPDSVPDTLNEAVTPSVAPMVTRSGRISKPPARLDL